TSRESTDQHSGNIMAIMGSSAALVICTAIFLAGRLQRVQGHLYLMTPVSRNLWGTTAFNEPSFEFINFCPHCYQSRGPAAVRARAESLTNPKELASYGNGAWPLLTVYEKGEIAANGNYLEPDSIAVRHGICGDPEQTAAEGSNRYGNANSMYPVLETYTEGSVLEVKVVVSTTHHGHLEFFLCDTSDLDDPEGVVTQGCFNMHPLDRAEDDGDASPIDPNFPGRYFVDPTCRSGETDQTILPGAFPGDVITARYQLPSGVTCSHCVVQMAHYTGNSCMHPGYEEFNPPSWPSKCAPNKGDWILTGLNMCGVGDSYPEEYWNCADIEITSDGTPSDPAPVPAPAPEVETPAPVGDEPGNPQTFAPFFDSSTMTETPAPVDVTIEETPTPNASTTPDAPAATTDKTMLETPTPSTEKVMTEAPAPTPKEAGPPATFAPSVAATELPPDECEDPVAAYSQCGGTAYEGSTCCRPGYECTAIADCFSECHPIADTCSEGWGQCGGNNWEGPTCCWPGAECLERNEWFSQCVPDANA
ncbi:unnamed protein product, partial [Ascophyllum nodosum]